ncbi:hypothetical protein [Cognatilysobacter bugurensis]|uniref:hypothetical protein n=1 Tax=Cognatilysobacter bugurensis TaxID=543356 RepID=UPI00167B4C37|nr:hypothetical protein [Lysobacter bugurensis]
MVALVVAQGWWRHVEPLRPTAHFHVDAPVTAVAAGTKAMLHVCAVTAPCEAPPAHQHWAAHSSLTGFEAAANASAPSKAMNRVERQLSAANASTHTRRPVPDARAHRHAHGRDHSLDPHQAHVPPSADSGADSMATVDRVAHEAAPSFVLANAAPDATLAAPEPRTAHRHDVTRDHRHAVEAAGVVLLPSEVNVAALETLASAFEPGWSLAAPWLTPIDVHHATALHCAVRSGSARWHGEAPERPPSPHASV